MEQFYCLDDILSVHLSYSSNVHMPKDISIKELREHLSDVADRAERGETFRVIRRSKPSFIIMRIDDDDSDEGWETVVDFTDGGKRKGVSAEEVLKEFKKLGH